MTANDALLHGLVRAIGMVLRPPCNGSCRAEDCARCESRQASEQDAGERYKEPWSDFEPDDGDGYDRPGTCSYERNPSDKFSSVAR